MKFLLLALFPILVSAYSDTSPVVAWSSHRSNVLEALPSILSKSSTSKSAILGIVTNDEICGHDAVIFIDQPGLHASDLRGLRLSSSISKRLDGALSSVQLPYTRSSSGVSFPELARSISSRCNSHFVDTFPGRGYGYTSDSKHVVCLNMDTLHGSSSRKTFMSEQESLLASELDILTAFFPKHLIIYSSSHTDSFHRRQVDSFEGDAFVSPFAPPSNTTLQDGGILKRYQLLTPTLIVSLLVVFFLLIPVVLIGVNALSSIQSPLREAPPKAFNARDKKNQ